MRKLIPSLLLTSVLLLLIGAPVLAAPTIPTINNQVTVLSDGTLNVRYQLTFLENESRNKITTLGPFDPGHQMLEAKLDYGGGSTPIDLVSQGDNKYTANFGMSTQPGETYTVTLRYQVNRPLDATNVNDQPYRVFAWSPPEWALPIGEEIVTVITPIELAADITQPEQVTNSIVEKAGLLENASNKAAFDRWVYYPTPDSASGKNYLSLYISKKNLPANGKFPVNFFIPGRYFAQIGGSTSSEQSGTSTRRSDSGGTGARCGRSFTNTMT